MNDWARCRAIFLSEPSCIPYLNVFPCSKKGGKRIDPRPLLQTFFFLVRENVEEIPTCEFWWWRTINFFHSQDWLEALYYCYLSESLKAATRVKRGTGIQRRVVGDAAIPRNWQNFLRVDSNKTELFAFLSNALLRSLVQEDKKLVVTTDMEVLSKPPLPDRSLIAPCTCDDVVPCPLENNDHGRLHALALG